MGVVCFACFVCLLWICFGYWFCGVLFDVLMFGFVLVVLNCVW